MNSVDPHHKIKDLQIEMSRHYNSAKPSTHKKIAWIYATNNTCCCYPNDTENSGKWCLFVHTKDIDNVWSLIQKSTECGELGDCIKVTTKLGHRLRAHDKPTRAICVYTFDGLDKVDIERVHQKLTDLGLERYIDGYKLNKDSM